jgi:hypothetical protein
MKNLVSIGCIAAGSIAFTSLPLQSARAANLVQNGNFAPTTAQSTTIRWGADNPNVGGATSAANQTIIPNWTSEGYNFLVRSGNAINTTNTPNVNFYGSRLNVPTGAGNYFIAGDSAYQAGRIYQDLSGLVVGQQYLVKFYQAAAQQNGWVWDPNGTNPSTGQPTGAPSTTTRYNGDTTDNWIVNVGGNYTPPTLRSYVDNGITYGYDNVSSDLTSSFSGGTTYVSPTMNLLSQHAAGSQTYASGNGTIISGTGAAAYAPTTAAGDNSSVAAGIGLPGQPRTAVGWQQDSFSFTATNTTQRLSFLSQGTPAGQPPFALLAGVSVEQLPEPADYVGTLIGAGAVGLAIRSRLKRKKLEELLAKDSDDDRTSV